MGKITKQRVAVTGIGMVSPLGHDVNSSWQALLQGKSGIEQIASFDASEFPTTIAAEVKNFTMPDGFDPKLLKQTVPSSRYALSAAKQAFDDAGISPNKTTASDWGMVVGSGMMTTEYEYWQRFQQLFAIDGDVDIHRVGQGIPEFFSVADFAKTQGNTGLGLLLRQFGIQGYATSVHTACASGGQALGLAMQVIRRGECDTMLAGGFDSMINPFGLSSFCLLGALSTMNDQPTKASRPFDYTRDGFVLGEGAAFLILEAWDKAKARGAHIYAELAGEGNSISSYRITDSHPSGDGAIQAIENALLDANVDRTEIDYINAHGTSTKMNDLSETNAIKAVFKDEAFKIPVSSTKSQTGHLIAAAGALEATFCILAMRDKKVPMTMNLAEPDPECNLDYITDNVRDVEIRAVVSNSFGFGGSNSCLVFKNPIHTNNY